MYIDTLVPDQCFGKYEKKWCKFLFFLGLFWLYFDPGILLPSPDLQFDGLNAQLCPVLDPVMINAISKLSSGTTFGDRGFLAPQQNRRGHMFFHTSNFWLSSEWHLLVIIIISMSMTWGILLKTHVILRFLRVVLGGSDMWLLIPSPLNPGNP